MALGRCPGLSVGMLAAVFLAPGKDGPGGPGKFRDPGLPQHRLTSRGCPWLWGELGQPGTSGGGYPAQGVHPSCVSSTGDMCTETSPAQGLLRRVEEL